jgi:hypothetical protein
MSADLEFRLRELPARLDALQAPADLADRVRRRHRRGTRLRVVAAAAAAAAVLAGTAVAVGRPDPAPPAGPAPTASPGAPPHGPAPTDPQLLRWPTRGPLAADAAERERVMRDLEAGAWADQDTGLRAPSRRPTHILWLGPAYPGPLPVPASRAALIQQWAGDRRLLAVLENPGDGYRLVTVAASELDPDRPLVALWSPGACRQPPAGRYCPHRWATVLLATPGTRRIALTSGPPADPFDPRTSGGWHPLPVVDGYAFITLTPAEVAPTLQVRFDGGVPVSLRYWISPLGRPTRTSRRRGRDRTRPTRGSTTGCRSGGCRRCSTCRRPSRGWTCGGGCTASPAGPATGRRCGAARWPTGPARW